MSQWMPKVSYSLWRVVVNWVLDEEGLAEVTLKLVKKSLASEEDHEVIDWIIAGLKLEQSR